MIVKFAEKELQVRAHETYPSRLRPTDLLIGPGGSLLEVLTVQSNCPIWESNRTTICAVLVRTEQNKLIPLNGVLSGKVKIYRKIKR